MFDVDAIEAVEVCLMAVFVPPSSSVRHGTAGDERCQVPIFGGEDPVVMVGEGVTWEREEPGDYDWY